MSEQQLRAMFQRRWVCGVVRSGYHNGARCQPKEPHHPEWGCCFRWEASLPDSEPVRALLGVQNEAAP